MKHIAVALLGCLALMGCREGGQWSGSLVAHAPISVIGPDGQISMEIVEGSVLEAYLYQEPNRTWIIQLRDSSVKESAFFEIPNKNSSFQYGRVYRFQDFGQNFDLSVRASLSTKVTQTSHRTEYCYEMQYVCSWDWKDGEYTHTCEHKYAPGNRTVEYQTVRQTEIIEGEFYNHLDEVVGEFDLSRELGSSERIVRTGACRPEVM